MHYIYVFAIFIAISTFRIVTGACPTNCKAGRTCDAADSGCAECEREYFGRHCQHRLECRFIQTGTDYQGIRNTSLSGKTCQRWDTNIPHFHGMNFPKKWENYCRNPNGEAGPWCYTTDPNLRWEYCVVHYCVDQCTSPFLNRAFVDVTNPPPLGFTVGFNAIIGCMRGSEASVQPTVATITCQNDKTWTDSTLPTCNKVKCPSPELANGRITNPKVKYEYQDSVTIECDRGYTLQGQSTLTCQADKSWKPLPSTCNINECPAPATVPNSNMLDTKDKYVYLDSLTIECKTGYTLQGQEKIHCQANKTWTALPTCEINKCNKTDISNGSISPSPSKMIYQYNDKIVISCDVGFTLQGQAELTCQANKTWGAIPTCIINKCKSPTLNTNSTIQSGMEKSEYVYMDTLRIICSKGYTLLGESKLLCQANETWSASTPSCEINKCPSIKYIPNSNIENSSVLYKYTDVISIICNTGFAVKGSSKLTCQANKTWDMDPPTCEMVECLAPDSMPNALYIKQPKNIYVYGEVITLSCRDGHTMKGKETAVCQQTKEWSKPFPVCQEEGSPAAAIAGGVVGTLAAIALIIAVVIFFIWRRKKKDSQPSTPIVFHDIEKLDENKTEPAPDNVYANLATNEDQPDNTYYNVGDVKDIASGKIQTKDLRDYMRKKSNNVLEEEFKGLLFGLQRPTEAAMKTKNRAKNKYKNIYPYDDNRIYLKKQPGVPESDYINASPIKGFDGNIKYIAAQGPQPLTHSDFWRMVLEQNIRKIVMLTNPFENGANKCVQYWPDEDILEVSSITIEKQSSDEFADYVVRRLKLTQDGDTALVHQYHFTTWPDKGVPKCPSVLAQFHRKVCDMPVNGGGPLLVHCSAGIGRTGTFIALDYLLDEASATGSVGVRTALEIIREQRVNMVQTKEQYVFLHNVLIEALELRSSIVTAAEFPEKYKAMLTRNKTSGKTPLQQEYESMKESVSYPKENAVLIGKREANKMKNRYSNILPTDENRVFLRGSSVDENYINAVYLPGYRDRHAYVVTQTPLSNTMENFWKMIFDENITTIVMMNQETNPDEIYWTEVENKPMEFGEITINLKCTETETNFRTLSFEICRDKTKRVIKQYQVLFWPDTDPAPTAPSPMLQLIEKIQEWAHQNESRPILIHCMNGADKSGLMCSAMAVLDRLKSEQDVCIQSIIKQFRTIRPQVIPNMEQFRYCFDMVGAYIDTFETYSNFGNVL